MEDICQQLAEFLGTMPQRYPTQSESGIHCRILKHIFTPMVMKLKAAPETATEVAARIGGHPEELEKTLYGMPRKDRIYRMGKSGGYRYMASAFLVGII